MSPLPLQPLWAGPRLLDEYQAGTPPLVPKRLTRFVGGKEETVPPPPYGNPLWDFGAGPTRLLGYKIVPLILNYTYIGHAKAGADVAVVMFDNHQPKVDGFISEGEPWISWSEWATRQVPFLGPLDPGQQAVGWDTKENLYTAERLGGNNRGFIWILTSHLTHDIEPGDVASFAVEPGLYDTRLTPEENASAQVFHAIYTPPFPEPGMKLFEEKWRKHELPAEIETWLALAGAEPATLPGRFEQYTPLEMGFYAYAVNWYKGGVGLDPLPEPREEAGGKIYYVPAITLTTANPLNPALPNLPFAGPQVADPNGLWLSAGDWTGSATPDGGIWTTLLNATSHGNHMVVEFLAATHPAPSRANVGTGAGHASLVNGHAIQPPGGISGPITGFTSVILPDETFGVGEGALKQPGKRITITEKGDGWLANAGHLEGGEDVTGAISPLYNYLNWQAPEEGGPSLNRVLAAFWAEKVFTIVRRYWREAKRLERMPMPVEGEVRLSFQVTGHTVPRWRIYGSEGEDAYTADFALRKSVGGPVLVGDKYVAGVKVGAGVPLEFGAAEAVEGVELVVRDNMADGLGEAGREKMAEWHFDLAEAAMGIYPTAASRFNTLSYNWHVALNLYFRHPDEKLLTVDQPQVATLTHTTSKEPSEEETPKPEPEETKKEKEEREKAEKEKAEKEATEGGFGSSNVGETERQGVVKISERQESDG